VCSFIAAPRNSVSIKEYSLVVVVVVVVVVVGVDDDAVLAKEEEKDPPCFVVVRRPNAAKNVSGGQVLALLFATVALLPGRME
jgi:hypothetical protein